ncbi:hypothetical protein AX769_21885 (plasmid) [Frondihabitans sp. PAMC 28766]|uniref:hypothetical protein n=1 Tax=Frondihabitans sp. PAMC 28766 TaxID=1795630 RepID=UPI00078D1CBA|nr:hypothetical protein [Frondihabitans sp. PAMC 28766]AMM22790.1 hypothetical protein AX769_21885 [Frondihabitans sp. PAMC 28766]
MIITYSRPDTIGQALDPDAPALDLSNTGSTCGASTYDVDGFSWNCTRPPHPGDDRHQGARALPGQSTPVVGLEWE